MRVNEESFDGCTKMALNSVSRYYHSPCRKNFGGGGDNVFFCFFCFICFFCFFKISLLPKQKKQKKQKIIFH